MQGHASRRWAEPEMPSPHLHGGRLAARGERDHRVARLRQLPRYALRRRRGGPARSEKRRKSDKARHGDVGAAPCLWRRPRPDRSSSKRMGRTFHWRSSDLWRPPRGSEPSLPTSPAPPGPDLASPASVNWLVRARQPVVSNLTPATARSVGGARSSAAQARSNSCWPGGVRRASWRASSSARRRRSTSRVAGTAARSDNADAEVAASPNGASE